MKNVHYPEFYLNFSSSLNKFMYMKLKIKLLHSLKFQFILLFSVFIVVLSAVMSITGIQRLLKTASGSFASMGIYTVEKAAAMIDGDSFEALAKSLDKNDPFYEETRVKLLRFRENSGCLYLYTMARKQGSIWQYIIDGSAEPGDPGFSFLGDEEDTSDYDNAFRKVQVSGRTEPGDLADQEEWGWMVSIYTPIFNSSGKMVGIVGCDFDGTFLHNAIVEEAARFMIIGLVSVLAGLALVILFLNRLFSRLQNINSILKEISLGEGDLTSRIEINSDDEIAELAKYFNMTLDKIRNMVIKIKKEAVNLHLIGGNLALNMDHTAGAINQITGNIQDIKLKVNGQSSSVSQTNAVMEQVTVNIDRLGNNVEAQSGSVTQSSSAIEEMVANINSVAKTLIQNAKNVDQLINVSETGRSSLQKVTQDIQEIARESAGLMEINAVMKNISSQTNLLSMNAAIEAAHAGEAGTGFAVVAGEIRKLAIGSADQSKTISAVLKRIKTAIETITNSTNKVLEKFWAIDERVRTVSDQEISIRNAMEEQGAGSRQILEAIEKLNQLTLMVKQSSAEMREESREVIRESNNLEKVTLEITESMHEMANSASEINAAVNHVKEISKTNKDSIDILISEVSRFRVD